MNFESALQSVMSGGNSAAVAQATSDHVASMDTGEVTRHLQTAADNATANGQPDVAHEIQDIVTRAQTDPASLKSAAISYVQANPQVLAHFAPSFAQGILSKL